MPAIARLTGQRHRLAAVGLRRGVLEGQDVIGNRGTRERTAAKRADIRGLEIREHAGPRYGEHPLERRRAGVEPCLLGAEPSVRLAPLALLHDGNGSILRLRGRLQRGDRVVRITTRNSMTAPHVGLTEL